MISHKYVLILISFLLPVACNHRPVSETVIASYGDIRIHKADYERSYYQFWQTTHEKDNADLRRAFARQLIEQELIAAKGERLQLDTLQALQDKLAYDRKRFARRRYLERTIRDTITPPNTATVKTQLKRKNIELKVSQIYQDTKNNIMPIYQKVHSNPQMFDQYARSLPWLSWGDTDWPVENVLYQLQPGQISEPVRSLMGWHIFRLDSIRQTLQFQEPATLHLHNMRQRIMNRKFDHAAAEHIREQVWKTSLAIHVKPMQRLWNYIEPMVKEYKNNPPLHNLSTIEHEFGPSDILNSVIATVDGQPFYVDEFVDALPDLPRNLLRPNLKKAIEIAIRDKIMNQIALQAGMGKDAVVREKLRRQRITYMYYATIAHQMKKQQQPGEAQLQTFYEANKASYIKDILSEVRFILVHDAATARQLAKAIDQGASFAEMARRYSMHQQSRQRNGLLGKLSRNEEPIGQKAAQLQQGQIFAPVNTGNGFAVIQVSQQDTIYQTFAESLEQVRKNMKEKMINTIHRQMLPADYDPRNIHYNDRALKNILQDSDTVF
ncbi:MAG: hypothetical protein GF313_17550 [Caldithrix sp.]|nr:hypothetical protein [Caldithrix sp.]